MAEVTADMKTLTINEDTFEIVDAKSRNDIEQILEEIEEIKTEMSYVASAKIGYVTLSANKWVGSASPYSQVVSVSGTTENSQVDLTPSVEQLSVFWEKDLAFVTENDGGTVTVYAIGQKPLNDYTIQVTITEVE